MSTRPSSSKDEDRLVQQPSQKPGKHNFLIKRVLFEIDKRYLPVKAIGKGAFGVVCSAKDEVTGETIAIKKISNAFDSVVDSRRALREIRLLRQLSHENIIQLKDILRPANSTDFRDVYLVYELMDTDLHSIIRSSQPLSDDHVQYFIYQVLRGLKYVHSANVLHRDLKPSNLLLKANCDLKICDFGLARTQRESESSGFMTDYVVTRWYRAPELLVSCDSYSAAIDVWSVGCILAELLGRKALWPGKTYIDQLQKILAVLGTPMRADTEFIDSDKARAWIHSQPITKRTPWATLYPAASADALDLLQRMLQFNPNKRISVTDALEHPYMAAYHEPPTEVVAAGPIDCSFERMDLNEQQLRELAYTEVMEFHALVRSGTPGGAAASPMEIK